MKHLSQNKNMLFLTNLLVLWTYPMFTSGQANLEVDGAVLIGGSTGAAEIDLVVLQVLFTAK